MSLTRDITPHFKALTDWAAAGTAIGTFLSVLPKVAALFTIIWYGIRIWESDTVRKIMGRL